MKMCLARTMTAGPRTPGLLRGMGARPVHGLWNRSGGAGPGAVGAAGTRLSSYTPVTAAAASGGAERAKQTTLLSLQGLYARGERITMVTAHDVPSAASAAAAGVDSILIGDSLAMVALGLEHTAGVSAATMEAHCASVARGAPRAFRVGDLPMGSYEVSPAQAVASAIRFVKHGHVHAVKLEGGADVAPAIARIVAAGIPVLAHVGLTPQRQNALGGFRVQGKTAQAAWKVWQDARAVQAAGAWGVVLEAVPAPVAARITQHLAIPTIGIGAGSGCSGQVLVQVDLLGYAPPERRVPKFVKKFGDVWAEATRAMERYKQEVKAGTYPAQEHTYTMPAEDLVEFERLMELDDAGTKP